MDTRIWQIEQGGGTVRNVKLWSVSITSSLGRFRLASRFDLPFPITASRCCTDQKNTKPGWDAGHLPMLGTKPHRFTTEIPWAPWGSELVLGQELIHPVKGPLIRQTHRQKDLSIDAGWLHWWIWVYQYWDDLGSYQNEYQHVKHVDTYWLIGSL